MFASKRLFAVSLAVLTLLPLAACDKKEAVGVQTTSAANEPEPESETEETTAAVTTALPDTDWEGRTFMVLGNDNPRSQFTNIDIYAQSENGDVVNDAVYSRNSGIEEKYNVKIAQTLFDNTKADGPIDILKKSVLGGESTYDLAFLLLQHSPSAANAGYFKNIAGLEYVDYTRDYWNSEVNNALTIGGKLFYTTSDFSLGDKRRTYIMVYNRELAATFECGNLVDMVNDGVWTTEQMQLICDKVSADVDGDGETTDADRFGVTMDSRNAFTAFITGMDNKIVEKDSSGKIVLTANNDHMISSIDKAIALTCDKNKAIFCEDYEGKVDYDYWSVFSNVFYDGRSEFMVAFTHSLSECSANCDFDYGVLPFPKYDEAQEDYCSYPDFVGTMVFGIPTSASDASFSGFMLEALSAASTNTSLHAYYQVACKDKYTYDENSAAMLDLIFSNIRYDLGVIYSFGKLHRILYQTIPSKGSNMFASMYEKIESRALKDIENLENLVTELP